PPTSRTISTPGSRPSGPDAWNSTDDSASIPKKWCNCTSHGTKACRGHGSSPRLAVHADPQHGKAVMSSSLDLKGCLSNIADDDPVAPDAARAVLHAWTALLAHGQPDRDPLLTALVETARPSFL